MCRCSGSASHMARLSPGRRSRFRFLRFEEESPPAIPGMERAIYNLAIAGDRPLPETFNSIYERNVTKSVGYQALQQAHAGWKSSLCAPRGA